MNNAMYSKTMEKLRNRVDVILVSNNLKWTLKPSYMSHKLFDNDLVAIRKSKVISALNKPAYVRICILYLSKEMMYELHYDYIKNKYGNNSIKQLVLLSKKLLD